MVSVGIEWLQLSCHPSRLCLERFRKSVPCHIDAAKAKLLLVRQGIGTVTEIGHSKKLIQLDYILAE